MLMVVFLMAKNLVENRGKSRFETIIWCIQLILLSAGVISIVLLFKTAVIPYSVSKVSTLPLLWLSFKSWLSPPYIYVIINFIIVVIATSSTFHGSNINKDHHDNNKNYSYDDGPCLDDGDYGDELPSLKSPPSEEINVNQNEDVEFLFHHPDKTLIIDDEGTYIPSSPPEKIKHILVDEQEFEKKDVEDFENTDTMEATWEAIIEDRKFKHILVDEQEFEKKDVEDFENTDTMEATWEAIIEDRKLAGKKELKKMETWNAVSTTRGRKEMRKLETFNESVLGRQRGGMRRDVSMSQDELKSRIEAFISKFNKDMILQREESEQRFLEMINR